MILKVKWDQNESKKDNVAVKVERRKSDSRNKEDDDDNRSDKSSSNQSNERIRLEKIEAEYTIIFWWW